MRIEAKSGLALAVLGVGLGCTGKHDAEKGPRTPDEASRVEARPVFAEAPVAPEPLTVGAGSEAIVSLRTPHARAEAQRVLDDYVHAIVRESNVDVSQLFTDDATMGYTERGSGSSAVAGWSRRFAQRDYTSENPVGLYDAEHLQLYTARDVAAHAEHEGLAFSPEGSELVLRVPLAPSNPSGRFGDEIQLLLVPGERGLRIRRIFERGYTDP
jgi:hypothetical protein